MSPQVTLLVLTDGRRHCLEPTLESFQRNVESDDPVVTKRIVVNDSPDVHHGVWLHNLYYFDEIIPPAGRHRRGFAGAIAAGWKAARGADFVFHLEDDFIIERPVDLAAMIYVLESNPNLAQLALRRQAWNEAEQAAGGIIEQHPDDYHPHGDGENHWIEHRRFFTTNPCLYPKWVMERGWPLVPNSEGIFSLNLFQNPQVTCGFWGQLADLPWVTHIGEQRTGTGY